ncbi:D-alanyl-D-alanine carboxypeptidase family protein [Halorhodospira neutriphila]|uniref:D-alanyl-D-alanine carboxypeptidase family protein n=1 Tax=Halorhodospira neutriphila TaxID=168379 RepID=UPI0030841A80
MTLRTLVLALLLGLLAAPAAAQARWGEPIVESTPVPSPPAIAAPNYVLVDLHSGDILAQGNPKTSHPPASLTKLMTAYVVFRELSAGNISLDDQVTISEKAWRAEGSRMFVEVGDQVSVEKLLQGMIVQSGNDASVALAEYVAGDERTFAQLMNQHAERLGMENTHYTNATGMPDSELRTTALDTARLAKAIIEEFPEYYDWYSQRAFTYAGITQHNRNKLLWRDSSVDGLKTGYTSNAGYNLTTSAKRDGMRLISVVLGADSAQARIRQSHQLLNYGFRFFETHRLYTADEALTETKLWQGAQESISLGVPHDIYVTIPRREYDNLSASMSVDGPVIAPIGAGEPLGRLRVELADTTIHEAPLVSQSEAEKGGLWGQMIDKILLRFQ